MGTNDRLKTKPPLPPKPQINCGTQLVSPLSRTNSTADARYRPIPKPRLQKPGNSLNQADNADQASLRSTETAASDGSSESHSVPPACPLSCPCVCHNASQNRPNKPQEDEDNYIIASENNVDKDPKRVPPDIPVPARPLPKEPWKTIIRNGNETGPSDDSLKTPFKKPVPTARKRGKENMVAQEKSKYQHQEPYKTIINELCQKFLSETEEKPKNEFGKAMLSKEVMSSQTNSHLSQFQESNDIDKTKQKNFSVKRPTTVSKCSRSQSFETSAKWPEQSSAASSLQRMSSQKVNEHSCSWKMLQEKYWQERCVVKENGILNTITEEVLLLQESIYEVATSEQSYLERLTVVVNHFMESPELNSAITPQVKKLLFSSMHKMREISQNFLYSMVQKLDSSLLCDGLCDVVHNHASKPFTAYVNYIRDMPYQKDTLINLRKKSPRFVEIENKLQEDPCCMRLTLDSFLSLPFQRISHIKVLMETILKRTNSNSNVQASAGAALTRISEVLDSCNREVGRVKQIEELISIDKKIEFECKALPLVSASRWLIREGKITQLVLDKNIFGQKKNCSLHFILFNDFLLVASKKGSDSYVVHDYAPRFFIEVTEGAKLKDDLEGYEVSRVFRLVMLKNHRGVSYQLLLQTSTLEERDSWLQVLRNEEGVYEEWDCPQVRCVEAYNGQQPGELSLQLDDIVSIIQKSDGLMEGQRFPDGERGWFPAKCVMEISNEQVQRRNLLQRHHVLQTAAFIQKCRSIYQKQYTTTCFNKN
ncbi:ephexin-1 [Hemibagrus wyckioides]|nr:ephexin-1 [Hemibagrus wyckioides]